MLAITSQQLFFTIENLKILYAAVMMQTMRYLKRIACKSKAKSKYFEMQFVVF